MGKEKSVMLLLKKFKAEASRHLPIKKMILFGSTASGKTREDSDIDLIIVSDRFKGMKFRKRATQMYAYWDLDYPVDFLCYTLEEFNRLKSQITLVSEAVKEGVEI